MEARLAGVEPLPDRTTRLTALSPQELDAPRGDGWTVREIATHLDGSRYYADAVGPLP